jgi:hypothetical protein
MTTKKTLVSMVSHDLRIAGLLQIYIDTFSQNSYKVRAFAAGQQPFHLMQAFTTS